MFTLERLAKCFYVTNREQYSDAVDYYRDILRSVVEHEGKVRTDELQQLHTLHNLNHVLQLKPDGR